MNEYEKTYRNFNLKLLKYELSNLKVQLKEIEKNIEYVEYKIFEMIENEKEEENNSDFP